MPLFAAFLLYYEVNLGKDKHLFEFCLKQVLFWKNAEEVRK